MRSMEFWKMSLLDLEPEAMDKNIADIAARLRLFMRPRSKALICFPASLPSDFGTVFEQAVRIAGGIAMFWQPDIKWKTLLRLAFFERVETIIAPPLVVLGLAKLARATATPLYIRNAITAGYPCADWISDGIIKVMDCNVWDCCGHGTGHADNALSEALGADLYELFSQLHSWTSVLDVLLHKSSCGLEMELVVFPGQKLPTLPNCAKRLIKAWDPEQDEPFDLSLKLEIKENTWESH